METSVNTEVIASKFDEPVSRHVKVAYCTRESLKDGRVPLI